MIASSRRTVAQYLADVDEAVRERYMTIPAPRTVDELRTLIAHDPDIARRFLPTRAALRGMNISTHACREVQAFSVEHRERFLKTLALDADFRAAVRALIGGAA